MYDGGDVVVIFDNSGAWQHRYLHGDVVDQVFMQENIGEILWGLADNQGSIRDVVNYDPTLDTSAVLNHRRFNAFGGITSESDPNIKYRYAYTGRYFDEDTGIQYNRGRWYDAETARFLSRDPSGLGPDVNPYRYVGNSPANYTDPSGLDKIVSEGGLVYWVSGSKKFKIGVETGGRFTDVLGVKPDPQLGQTKDISYERLVRRVRELTDTGSFFNPFTWRQSYVTKQFRTERAQWRYIEGLIKEIQIRDAEDARRIPGTQQLRPLTANEQLGTNVDRFDRPIVRGLNRQVGKDGIANGMHNFKVGFQREAIYQGASYLGCSVVVAGVRVVKAGSKLAAKVTFRHTLKTGATTNKALLRNEIRRHVDAWNKIIEKEGMAGLKRRLRQYEEFGPQIDRAGRRYTSRLGKAGKGKVWPHYPDMAAGGKPKSAVGAPADKRLNSIIGGQAKRLREQILELPDNISRIDFDLIIK